VESQQNDRLAYVERIVGDFTLAKRAAGFEQVLMVGTGTGLAPFVSMVKQLHRDAIGGKAPPARYTLFHANRTHEELAYHQELLDIEESQAFDFVYVPSVSRTSMQSLRVQEHREAATRAGLSYVTDGVAGIRRQRAGRGWVFFAPDGSRIGDAAERARIQSLVIPPAWTDVWICPDPRGHIQVTARDTRGRKQYRYHPWYRDARDKSKFRRMLEFSEILPDVRERVERDLRAHDLSRRQVLATV